MSLHITAKHQSFPLAQVFTISRGSKTSAEVVVVTIEQGRYRGWAEAVPYARYGESVEQVLRAIDEIAPQLTSLDDHHRLDQLLPAGSARNALDCAFWDLRAKVTQQPVHQMLGLPLADSCVTAQTLSISSIQSMRQSAAKLSDAHLIKVKLDADGILDKMQAIHQACPNSKFIVDANEGWQFDQLQQVAQPLATMNVVLIEQPLPADADAQLMTFSSPVALCADESCHGVKDLPELAKKYQAINIKLDKTGGLTEAVELMRGAQQLNMQIMLGCMVGSSLAMAPSYVMVANADYVDLDGPLLVAEDRENGYQIERGLMQQTPNNLWGFP